MLDNACALPRNKFLTTKVYVGQKLMFALRLRISVKILSKRIKVRVVFDIH